MLPRHRRDIGRKPVPGGVEKGPHGDSTWSRLVRFVIEWVKLSWRDILTIALLGGAALGIYQAPVPGTRNFPITFDASGDIVYPELAYPSNRGWIIPSAAAGVISTAIPFVVILVAQLRIRSFWDFNNAVLGLFYSLALASLFQVVIKILIGGFRPYWLDACQPDVSRAAAHNATGLNGVGFRQVMYTVEVCTNPDRGIIKTAMTSFPSGHATAAVAGYTFLFLWMNAKLKVWANFQASYYWLAALLAPILGAVLMAACLTLDMAHHWYDIVAGSVIGFTVAVMVYRLVYAAVWDWRFNHIPLRRDRVFDYTAAAALPADVLQRYVFTGKLGWGRKRRRLGRRAARGKGRVAGSGGSTGHMSNGHAGVDGAQEQGVIMPPDHPSYPESAAVRPNGPPQYSGRGEEMV